MRYKQRWVVKGMWSGPICPAGDWTPLQYRETTSDPAFMQSVRKLGSITFGDGTQLRLQVDTLEKYARKPSDLDVTGYGKLVRQCIAEQVCTVDALFAKRKQREAVNAWR